jgi:hypothetical protein
MHFNDKHSSTKVKETKQGPHQAEASNIYPDYKRQFPYVYAL